MTKGPTVSRQRTIEVTWDTDGEEVDLPEIVLVPADVEDEDVTDWLSDRYDWCVEGWCEAER
jgi:hypothetical protein